MAQDRPHLDLEGLVKTLRYVTAAVQILPFVYTVLYLVALGIALFASEDVVRISDSLFYVSPVTILAFLILSRLLHLCIWHKTACILPLLPQVVSFIDYNIVELSIRAATLNIIVFGLIGVALLFAAYKTFIA